MRARPSTRAHGIFDFLTVGAMLAYPQIANSNQPFKTCLTGTALTKLLWSLLTRNELGLVRLIPMRIHLLLDAVGAVSVAALPFAVDEEDPGTLSFCIGMAVTDLFVSALTDPTPSFDRKPTRARRPRISQNKTSLASGAKSNAPATANA
jgi:hypothetical protein